MSMFNNYTSKDAVMQDEVVLANANYVSGLNDYILLQMFHTTTAIDGACKSIKQMTQTKIRCLCYGRGSAEDSKVALRNIRRDALDKVKKMKPSGIRKFFDIAGNKWV